MEIERKLRRTLKIRQRSSWPSADPALARLVAFRVKGCMDQRFLDHLGTESGKLKAQGLYKSERVITSRQGARVTAGGKPVVNLCANNYLGLAGHPALVEEGKKALA